MKKVFLLLCISMFLSAKGQEFYYGINSKIPIDTTDMVLVVNANYNVDSFVAKHNATIVSSDNLFTTVKYSGKKVYGGNVFPVYKTKGGGLLRFTDDILFYPQKPELLDSIKESFPIEILSENKYYVRARVINSTYNALHVANRIYESGWVTYSHPSFIVEIEYDI